MEQKKKARKRRLVDEEEDIHTAKESWNKKGKVEHKKRSKLFHPPASVPGPKKGGRNTGQRKRRKRRKTLLDLLTLEAQILAG